jgi:TPR repeat protein
MDGRGVPKDLVKAFQYMRRAAESGDAKSEYNLGMMYERVGTAKDTVLAKEWIAKAAAGGSTDAMMAQAGVRPGSRQGATGSAGAEQLRSNAGLYYAAKDYRTNLRLLLEAARVGNAMAAASAAYQYRNGLGTAKNPVVYQVAISKRRHPGGVARGIQDSATGKF